MITVEGDTFETLSRRAYGSERGAAQIRRANPGLVTPLGVGVSVLVPAQVSAPRDRSQITAGPDVTILLSGKKFTTWSDLTIVRAVDAPPAVSITAPWDPSDTESRAVFKPFSYAPVDVFNDGVKLFSGDLSLVAPFSAAEGSTMSISVYGKTATFNDSTLPASAYSANYDGQTIEQIAASVVSPFGVDVEFDAPAGAPFERVGINTNERVMGFLTKLAKQRNMVLGESAKGALVFTQSEATGTPVAVLSAESPPVVNVEPVFSPGAYYTHITAISPTIVGLKGEQVTVVNPFLSSPLRPFTFSAEDSDNESLQQIAEAKLARMFANVVSWRVKLVGWAKSNGEVWEAGETVTLKGDRAMVYRATTLLIRTVTLEQNKNGRTAMLELILPGAFAGTIPESLPWEE